jgi:hypothetical protein
MESAEVQVNIIIAFIAGITAIAAYVQYRNTLQANTVLHFTKEYFSLGKEPKDFKQEDWNKYWSLHSTEFYFYKSKAIPAKMYALWIIEVADIYHDIPVSREYHQEFLSIYKVLYPEMTEFFTKVCDISKNEDKAQRHKEIAKLIIPYNMSWTSEEG